MNRKALSTQNIGSLLLVVSGFVTNALAFGAEVSNAGESVLANSDIPPNAQPDNVASPVAPPEQKVDAQAEAQPAPPPDAGSTLATIPVATKDDEKAVKSDRPGTVQNRVLEEIVVTAQKREENIQSVPIAIQAFSSEALAARGIDDTTQLAQSVPSLQFTSVEGFTLLSIRGIGTDNFIPSADPQIATYVDGIYIPQGESAVNSLGNVERVEVLEGPQGTLFGRNATGGAFSIITEEPGAKFKASAEAEAGNYSDRSAKVNVSGPITNWLSAGFSGLYSYEDSYYRDVNYAIQPTKNLTGRFKINIHPTDDLDLGLTAFYSKQQGVGTNIGSTTRVSLLGTATGITPQKNTYTSDYDYPVSAKAEQKIFYGHLTWKLPYFDLKLLGATEDVKAGPAYFDFDGSSQPLVTFSADNEFQKLQTGEVQIVSNADTPGADSFKWVTGLYYLHSLGGFDPAHFAVATGALRAGIEEVNATAGLNLGIPEGLSQIIAKSPLNNTPLGNGGLINLEVHGLLETKSYSGFAQGTYTFTDWLDLTAGGRYQSEKRFLTKASVGAVSPIDDSVIPVFDFPKPSATATNFSPKAVLSFHLDDSKLIYGSYSVGFQSGTFNVISIYTAPNYVVPQKVNSYEIGAKMDFFGGLLRLNTAVFDNQITDLQTGFISLLSGGAVVFETAHGARTRGAEFDGTLVPLPAMDAGLVVTANAAYVDAIYTDFKNGDGFDPTTGISRSNQDFSGKEISRAPKWSGSVGVVQTIDTSNGVLEVGADEYFNGGFYFDPGNNNKQGAYGTLNAHAGYLYTPWNARITAFGKNLLDRRYDIQQFQTDFGLTETLAAPREYGIRLNWTF